jgi:hypothetical protein
LGRVRVDCIDSQLTDRREVQQRLPFRQLAPSIAMQQVFQGALDLSLALIHTLNGSLILNKITKPSKS